MGLAMPSPLLIGNTFYLKIRVPTELRALAKDRTISLPVGDKIRLVKVGEFVKVSLDTREPREAKRRFSHAYASVVAFWQALKEGPKPLTMKQSVALAGEIRAAFIEAFDDEPGRPEIWEGVIAANAAARTGRSNPLSIPALKGQARDMEQRFGRFADVALASKGLLILPNDRQRLLFLVAAGLTDMARVNLAKAQGDYSDSGVSSKRAGSGKLNS